MHFNIWAKILQVWKERERVDVNEVPGGEGAEWSERTDRSQWNRQTARGTVWRGVVRGGTTSTQRTIITARTNWHVRNGEARRARKPQTYQLISSLRAVKLSLFPRLLGSPEVLGFHQRIATLTQHPDFTVYLSNQFYCFYDGLTLARVTENRH